MANTIDILGDDAVTDSIIDGSITELVDDQIIKLRRYAFYDCDNLTSVSLLACKSSESSVFENCDNLTSVNLPAILSIGSQMFYECKGLTSIILPVVRDVGYGGFKSCAKLTSVDLHAVTSIGSYAFQYCSKLTRVILRNTSQVATLYSNGFSNANNAIIYVPDALVDDYKAATNWSALADRIKGLSELPA